MLSFANRKKEFPAPKFSGDAANRGALSWAILVEDQVLKEKQEAYLAISSDSLVIIDSNSREPIFAIPCTAIIGWSTAVPNW